MRPHRAHHLLHRALLRKQCLSHPAPSSSLLLPRPYAFCIHQLRRSYADTSLPPTSHFRDKPNRFHRFEDPSEEIRSATVRNPLDYVNLERVVFRRSQILKKRILACMIVMAVIVALQVWIIFTFDDPETAESFARKGKKDSGMGRLDAAPAGKGVSSGGARERLDAPPGKDGAVLDGRAVVVKEKPGQPAIKLDAQGHELVETGTSTIPYFPKTVWLPLASSSASAATVEAAAGVDGEEEYTLLGLGIRTVSFLSIQVYVLGLYIRTTDLPALQSAFVKHINSIGTSLIPSEKAALKQQLLDPGNSLKIWDRILREAKVRSAVRIVPTRNTDFAHLRDGWVRGITGRAQETVKAGGVESAEYEGEGFGEAMKGFKSLFGGRGKAPRGSTLFLVRDERGALGVWYESEDKRNQGIVVVGDRGVVAEKGVGVGNGESGMQRQNNTAVPREMMGRIEDERIARQVWLGYLAGGNVSSEGARKAIVEGVMELVERPVGTVGLQVT